MSDKWTEKLAGRVWCTEHQPSRNESQIMAPCPTCKIERLTAEVASLKEQLAAREATIDKLAGYIGQYTAGVAPVFSEVNDFLLNIQDENKVLREHEARLREQERENKILSIKANASLANNLCPDHRDKQNGKPCLACSIEQAESALLACQAREGELREALERIANGGPYKHGGPGFDARAALSHSTGSKIMAVVEAAKKHREMLYKRGSSSSWSASEQELDYTLRALEDK